MIVWLFYLRGTIALYVLFCYFVSVLLIIYECSLKQYQPISQEKHFITLGGFVLLNQGTWYNFLAMQNPNEDTQWNDILRSKGILPPKEKEVTEEDIVNLVESTVQQKISGKSLEERDLDELDELEDEEEERVLAIYRARRIAEIKALSARAIYGDVREISADDYVQQVNKAGEGVWVVLHLYKQGIPLCALLNQHLNELAAKFRSTKFLKSVSTTCIPNYPDKNLPTIFVYFEGDMKSQLIGPPSFRHADISVDELQWMLGQTGAIKSEITEDPRPKPKDALFSALMSDNNDWTL